IVTVDSQGPTRLWESRTGKSVELLEAKSANPPSLAYSPDGKRIITTDADGQAMVRDGRTGKSLFEIPAVGRKVRSVQFSLDGAKILTICEDGAAQVWRVDPVIWYASSIATYQSPVTLQTEISGT